MFEKRFGTMYAFRQTEKGGEDVEVFLAQAPKKFKDHVGNKVIEARVGTERIILNTIRSYQRLMNLLASDEVSSVTLMTTNGCSSKEKSTPQAVTLTKKRFHGKIISCLCHSTYHGGTIEGCNSPGREHGICEVCGKEVSYYTHPKPSVESLRQVFFH